MEMNSKTVDSAVLRAIYDLSQKISKRRSLQGAINIDLPEIHIAVRNSEVKIISIPEYRSASIVKECMIAAGEGAGIWAIKRNLAFPFISQDVDIQGKFPDGFAGSFQMRRCMRPRVLSTKPGRHQGLGLDTYTQVTSPLRRYIDLLAHIQIRTFLRGDTPLSTDEISARLGFSEAASAAIVQSERASINHWLMVYLQRSLQNLSDKKDSLWDAIALESKGNRWAVIIPSLGLETQVALQKNVAPNDNIKLILKSVNISRGEAVFLQQI
jgi:exoribonuclease-2